MVTKLLLKHFNWFEFALVCKWLSHLQVPTSERQSHNGTLSLESQNIYVNFRANLTCGNVVYTSLVVFGMKLYFNEKTSTFLTDMTLQLTYSQKVRTQVQ